MSRKIFKYNMTLYYQSLAVYFVSLIVYVLLRLQFSGFDWKRVTNDSIFYLFLILLGYVLLTTIYYLIKKKVIRIEEDKIVLDSKFKTIQIPFNKIETIRISRENKFYLSSLLRTIKIKIKNGKKKTIVIRPFDFENEDELMNELIRIKNQIVKTSEVKNA
ncbi:MAG: hypothetical protein N3F03_07555 [Ignavibacteria bacterium]|nr:hypothetical protein [Ignavibacteria bacterium]